MTLRFALTAACVVAALSACQRSDEPAPGTGTEIVKLIDLSATWHNSQSDPYNAKVLEDIDKGIVTALETQPLAQPVRITTYEIGSQSFNRPPLCDASYRPALTVAEPGVLRNVGDVDIVLDECRRKVLRSPVATLTDITGAINTVARGRINTRTRYILIVATDFQEDRGGEPSFDRPGSLGDLSGMDFVLVYRTVSGETVADLDGRLDAWTDALEGQGARVVASLPDSRANAKSLAPFIGLKRER